MHLSPPGLSPRPWLLLCAAFCVALLTGCALPGPAEGTPPPAAQASVRATAFPIEVAGAGDLAARPAPADPAPEEMMRRWTRQVLATALLAGFFAALAFGALLLWLQDRRGPVPLALALLALLAGARTLLPTGVTEHLYGLQSGLQARALLDASTMLLIPAAVVFLLWTAMPWAFAPLRTPWGEVAARERSRLGLFYAAARLRPLSHSLRLFNTYAGGFALLAGVGLTLAALLAPQPRLEQIAALAPVAALPLLVVLILVAAGGVYARHPVWPLFAVGFLGIAAAMGHDLLAGAGVIATRVRWLPGGLLTFFALFGAAFVTLRARAQRRTEQRNAELSQQVSARSKELQTASQAAQAAYLARSQFLTSISHELRTPLAAIMGYANLLEEEIGGTIEPQQREFLRAIAQSGERLLHLVDDLLDLSRIEAGRFALRPGPVDAGALAHDVHLQLYPLAHEKDLQFEVESRMAGDEATLVTDGMRLRQVLVNLVSNAVKFTPAGHVRLVVEPAVLEDRPALRFCVEDTGLGISPEFMPHLFDRFTQETRAYGHAQRGTGLGLHLSKELVTRMGGTLEVESEIDKGSVFTVTMPRGQ